MTETIQLTLFDSDAPGKGFRKHSSTRKKTMPSDEWFFEEYTVKLRSGESIAEDIGCCSQFVYKHLREIGIRVRGRHEHRSRKIDLSEHHDWINDQYRNGKSLKWLREHFGIGSNKPIKREFDADIVIGDCVRRNATPIVDLSGQWIQDAFQHIDDPNYRKCLYPFLREHRLHGILRIIKAIVKCKGNEKRVNTMRNWTPERRAKHKVTMSAAQMGKTTTEETKAARRVISKEVQNRPDVIAKQIAFWTPERRAERSAVLLDLWKDPKFIAKHTGESNPNYGRTGEKHPMWKDGSSLRYCYRFDEPTREHIRNLCNRTCTICGKSVFQYFKVGCKTWARLHVDHLDENKMQGCDDWEWRLTALCPSCHGKMKKRKIPRHLLLQMLLLNNKKHQTNFLF